MSTEGALKLATYDPPGLPADVAKGLTWIPLSVAAERSKLGIGTLRNKCLSQWGPPNGGLAKQGDLGNGQTGWLVHESADPRFAPVKFAQVIDAGFDTKEILDDRQDQLLRQRKQILDQWESEVAAGRKLRMTEPDVTARFVDRMRIDQPGVAVSRSTLFGWQRKYKKHGLFGLIDKRWKVDLDADAKDPAAPPDDEFLACVQRYYLRLNGPTLKDCVRVAITLAGDHGWSLPALTDEAIYKACQRHFDSLPPQLIIEKRKGTKAFTDQCEPALAWDYSSIDSNDCWIMDHHTFDVLVLHEGKHVRPTVTAAEDARSRKIVGTVVSPHAGNTDTILECLDRAIASHHKPKTIMVDNGDDFLSKALQGETKAERRAARKAARAARTPAGTAAPGWGNRDPERESGALSRLEIETRRVWKFHGQSKAIERCFKTVCLQFSKHFETYTGSNTFQKPENLARQVKAGKAPTLAEFTACFEAYLEDVYHQNPHHGDAMDGRCPADVFTACLLNPVAVDADRRKFALLPRVGPLRVSKQGVRYKGLCFGGFDAEMQRMFRQQVWIAVDNNDLSRVFVLPSANGKLLFSAKANIKLPFFATAEDLKSAIAEKKQLRKTLRQYVDRRPRMSEDTHQLLARAARRRRKAEANPAADPDAPHAPAPAPQPFVPAGDQNDSFTLRRAFQVPLKLAAGAESDVAPDAGRFIYGAQESAAAAPSQSSVSEIQPAGTPFIYRGRSAEEDES